MRFIDLKRNFSCCFVYVCLPVPTAASILMSFTLTCLTRVPIISRQIRVTYKTVLKTARWIMSRDELPLDVQADYGNVFAAAPNYVRIFRPFDSYYGAFNFAAHSSPTASAAPATEELSIKAFIVLILCCQSDPSLSIPSFALVLFSSLVTLTSSGFSVCNSS